MILKSDFKVYLTKVLMTCLIVLLFLAAFLTIFPFLWSVFLSTQAEGDIFATKLVLSVGDHLGKNYKTLIDVLPFWKAMANSFYISMLGTSVSLLFCSMGGYAFGVYQFKGKNLLFGILVGSMMIPPVLGMIPYFMIIKFLGIDDTLLSVWLPFTAVPIGVFLIRQYVVASIPKELLEAAKLDGAGEFRTYWSIVLPLLKPSLATLAIVQFVFFWNNFITPLVALSSREKYVLTLALRSIQNIPDTPWGAMMLGTVISILPLVTIYLLSSKRMISGLTEGAVKG